MAHEKDLKNQLIKFPSGGSIRFSHTETDAYKGLGSDYVYFNEIGEIDE